MLPRCLIVLLHFGLNSGSRPSNRPGNAAPPAGLPLTTPDSATGASVLPASTQFFSTQDRLPQEQLDQLANSSGPLKHALEAVTAQGVQMAGVDKVHPDLAVMPPSLAEGTSETRHHHRAKRKWSANVSVHIDTQTQASVGVAAPQVQQNTRNIATNRQILYGLEDEVFHNRFEAYEYRATIAENRDMLSKNYDAAFEGNRLLMNFNTDKIFLNRDAILFELEALDQVQDNFKRSVQNEANIDFLDHRSQLNARVAEVNEMLANTNTQLIAANSKILETNEMITQFNAKHIAINRQWLDGGLQPQEASPETNAQRIASNSARISEIQTRVAANSQRIESVDATASRNREAILKNAEIIAQRRQQINENHANMRANSKRIAALVTVPTRAYQPEWTSSNPQVQANTRQIRTNEKVLFGLKNTVLHNKFLAYEFRATIEENRDRLMKNYRAAFIGNRQLANFNTDKIFMNRKAILFELAVSGQVQDNFKGSLQNQASIDFLDHRSQLNARVAEVNEILADANTQLIAANSKILETNEMITQFNAKHIAINKAWLDGGLRPQDATPETNAQRITSNSGRISEIQARVAANSQNIQSIENVATGNREAILKNEAIIAQRREQIDQNHANMMQNSQRIADSMA